MSAGQRVLMIGLDAADPVLVERFIDQGLLPNLGRLRDRGRFARLKTSAAWLAGSPWPTFYTGQPPSHHGIYHDFQWDHERGEYAAPSAERLPVVPFWRRLEGGCRVIAYDVPMTPGCEPFDGLEVTGWASHDRMAPPDSHPAELLGEIKARFKETPIRPEGFGPSAVGELLALSASLTNVARRSAELASWLLERPWDLAIAVLGSLHPAGHRLWDRTSIEGEVTAEAGARFDAALRELYVTCDQAVGRLVEAARGATIIVFSLHGMMQNTTRIDLLDGMLEAVLREGAGEPRDDRPARRGLVRRLGEALPLGLRRRLTRSIPRGMRDRMMTRWTTGGIDWSRTRAFALRADLQGYVRVNLRDREPSGIVAREAYDALCEQIADGLLSFRDATTGARFVRAVDRSDAIFPPGPRSDLLPDLIVRWEESPGASHEAVASPRLGRVDRATPGRIPNGRSGNHRPEGFYLVSRADLAPAGSTTADILDLAPTALGLLGARTSLTLAGRPLFELEG